MNNSYYTILIGALFMLVAFIYFEYSARKDKEKYKGNDPWDYRSKFQKYRGFIFFFVTGFCIVYYALKEML